MRSSLLSLVILAAACGGTPKSTTPPPPLPDDNKVAAEEKPLAKEEVPLEVRKEPELPQGPLDIPLAMPKSEVKLVSAGKGKKQKLVVAPKMGAKQTAAWTLDLTVGQESPPQLGGGKQEQVAPTATLVGETEIKEVDATSGQAKYQLTVASVDAAMKPGAAKVEEFKDELQSLVGATFSGTVDANGATSDVSLHIEKPDRNAIGTGQFLQLAALPMWPVLPKEPIGTGAKWTVTSTQQIAGKLEITKTVNYELVDHKGNAWTIKGTTQVSGKDDQEVQPGAKAGTIAGEGTHEITLRDGGVLPTSKQAMTTTFTVKIEAPPSENGGKTPDPIGVKFWFNFGNAVELK